MISAKKNKTFYGYLEGWLSIVFNTLLFALKYWAGIVSGSVAIIADAWHTLSDSLTSIIVLIGTKISSKPADREHPFGHGRAELIGTIIISVLLAVVAVNFIIESISKLRSHEPADYGYIAIIVTVISIVVKEGLAQYAIWAGKKINLKSLIADGWHHRSDSISSIIILIGIFIGRYFWWIDGAMGIFVSLIIFYASFSIMKDTVSSLIGEQPDNELIENIHKIVNAIYPDDVKLHHVHIHNYGHHRELTFHIKLPDEMKLYKAHSIATAIETSINKKLNIETTIHIEPLEYNTS